MRVSVVVGAGRRGRKMDEAPSRARARYFIYTKQADAGMAFRASAARDNIDCRGNESAERAKRVQNMLRLELRLH